MDDKSFSPVAAEKLIDLEEKLMFQQRAIDDLNGVILQQQSEINRLQSELQANRKLIEDLTEQALGKDLPHEKPPHY